MSTLQLSFTQEHIASLMRSYSVDIEFISVKIYNDLNESFLRNAYYTLTQRHILFNPPLSNANNNSIYTIHTLSGIDIEQLYNKIKEEISSIEFKHGGSIFSKLLLFKCSDINAINNTKPDYSSYTVQDDKYIDSNIDSHFDILVLAASPLIADRLSLCILLDELIILYSAIANNNINDDLLPVLEADYPIYSDWQRDQLINSNLSDELWNYWSNILAPPLPTLLLPLDCPRPLDPTYKTESFTVHLPISLTNSLLNICSNFSISMYSLLLSAYSLLLFRYTGNEDIIVTSLLPHRNEPASKEIVGPLADLILYRLSFLSNDSFKSFSQSNHEKFLLGTAHQAYPYWLLLEKMAMISDAKRITISQTLFSYESNSSVSSSRFSSIPPTSLSSLLVGECGPGFSISGIELSPLHSSLAGSCSAFSCLYDLSLHVALINDHLVCKWIFSNDIFSSKSGSIKQLSHHFYILLKSIASDFDEKLSDLKMMDESEVMKITKTWNNTLTTFDCKHKCIHEFFEEQVRKNPNHKAVIAPDFNSNNKNMSLVESISSLSYEELNSQANQLARYLRFLGVSTKTHVKQNPSLVLIFLPRSPLFIVSLVAVIKSGGVCVPVDPSYPLWRIKLMIQQSDAKHIITCNSLSSKLQDNEISSLRVINIDKENKIISRGSISNLIPSYNSQNLAYILYTSGSTGIPKGVMLSHSAIINYINWHIPFYQMTSNDRHLHYASLSFDASIAETWSTLSIGGSLWMMTNDEYRLNPPKIIDWMNKYHITICFFTTQLAESLLREDYPCNHIHNEEIDTKIQHPNTHKHDKHSTFSLRVMYTGGDLLHHGLISPSGSFRLVNIYGPTETVINATLFEVPTGFSTTPSIGKPVPNVFAYILDANMQPVPIGVVGELYIGGLQLSKGYYKQPDLTSERFVHNPFIIDDNIPSILYKTGDLARFLPDGNIVFHGRKDTQVKVRGYRIELSEIESVLLNHSNIKSVCVIVREDTPGIKRIVSYLVLNSSVNRSKILPEIKSYLKNHLPTYMIPSFFIILDKLPLTTNGKVARSELPIPDTSNLEAANFLSASTPLEKSLVEILKNILSISNVNLNDSFFDIGGHSLAAAQFMSRINEKCFSSLGKGISLKQIFDSPSLLSLISLINSQIETNTTPHSNFNLSIPLPMSPVRSNSFSSRQTPLTPTLFALTEANTPLVEDFPLPLSYNQQQLFFLYSMDPSGWSSRSYNIPFACKIRASNGGLNLGTLHTAFDSICMRHASLRTSYHSSPPNINKTDIIPDSHFQYSRLSVTSNAADTSPSYCQVIHSTYSYLWKEIDVSDFDDQKISSLMLDSIYEPFDLENGPIMKVFIFSKNISVNDSHPISSLSKLLSQKSPQKNIKEYTLLWVIHHIACDLWSFIVLLNDLSSLYNSISSPLPPPKMQYPTYVSQQLKFLSSAKGEDLLSYWLKKLQNPPVLHLPTDHPRPPQMTYEGAGLSVQISSTLLKQLRLFAKNESTTLFHVFLAAYFVFLSRASNQTDIIVGTPFAGRNSTTSEDSVGYFVNMVAIWIVI